MHSVWKSLGAALCAAALLIGCADRSPVYDETAESAEMAPPSAAEDAAVAPAPADAVLGYAAKQRLAAPAGAAAQAFRQAHNTEQYDFIAENGFRRALDHPLSTFSIDVDAASYSNLRRFLRDGQLPPKDAVRVEEMVNYFRYDYPAPSGEHPFSVIAEVGAAPWNPAHRLVHIGLQGRPIPEAERPASNLVFLLDVSGSMNNPDKLPLLKRAFRLLVDQLDARDRVAIAVYAGAAGLVLPSTPGDDRQAILDALDRLAAGGSTAGAAGIRLAYDVARAHHIDGGNNRVILATDGDFNVGVSSDGELVRLIEQERAGGTFLTVLGFGTGNLKDSKMEKLAGHGNGNYYYVDGLNEARKVLVEEMGATLFTIAKDVKIQVEFNPAAVAAYRLIGYENRLLASEDFDDDAKDAGELGAGHTVTALYEIVPAEVGADGVRGQPPLRYQESRLSPEAAASGELMTLRLRYKAPEGGASRLIERRVRHEASGAPTDDFHFSAAVAAFGMVLRESEHRGTATAAQVLALASDALGEDPGGYRAEFLDLVAAYRAITEGSAAPAAAHGLR